MRYQFGDFHLNTDTRQLMREEQLVCDDEKIIILLEQLCVVYPELVTKQTLMEVLWPDQVVSDWSLSRLISDTRQLLEDSGKEQSYIKTLRGRGFRLNKTVEVIDDKLIQDTQATLKQPSVSQSSANNSQFKHSKFWLFALVIVGAVVSYFSFFNSMQEDNSDKLALRVAILPVMAEENDIELVDNWIKYGVMSLATEQLGRYQSIQTIPVPIVMNALNGLSKQLKLADFDQTVFEKICEQLGCSHLVAIKYKLDNNQPVVSYQIQSSDYRSPNFQFVKADVIDAVDLLLDNLAGALLPSQSERLSLKQTYSNNQKANRDYAIGVHELFSGDINSAISYLNLAIERVPDFFWASAYLAEAEYRKGHFSQALSMLQRLEKSSNNDKQAYFLKNLHSNILYSQGHLAESLQVSIDLIDQGTVNDTPLLRGNELLNIGSSLQALGQLKQATAYLKRSQKAYQQARYFSGEGKALFNLGNVYLTASENVAAIEHYQLAREIFIKYAMTGYALMAKHQIATTNMLMGKYQYAESELKQLINSYKSIGDTEGEYTAAFDLATVSAKKGNHQEALLGFERLLLQLEQEEFSSLQKQTLSMAIKTHLTLGNVSEASELYRKKEGEWNDVRPEFSLIPAQLQYAQGNFQEAIKTALQIKQQLAENWTDKHEEIIQQLQESLKKEEFNNY